MRKWKCLTAAALLSLATTAWADDGVVLLLKNGTTVGFAFSEKPAIVAGTSALTMRTSTGSSIEYAYDSVQRFYFSNSISPTSITVPETGAKTGVTFRVTQDAVEITGLSDGETATLYTADGRQAGKAVAKGGTARLTGAQRGQVYIVHTSTGVNYKLINR